MEDITGIQWSVLGMMIFTLAFTIYIIIDENRKRK